MMEFDILFLQGLRDHYEGQTKGKDGNMHPTITVVLSTLLYYYQTLQIILSPLSRLYIVLT